MSAIAENAASSHSVASDLVQDTNGIWMSSENETIHYPEEGNDNCFSVEDNSFWFQHRNQVILELTKRFPFTKQFADVGGGNGFQAKCITDAYRERKIFLIEPGYAGCVNAKRRGVEEVYNVTLEDFDLISHDVNGIGLFDVIEHIEDDVSFLNQMATSSKQGTRIYITVPAYNFLWSATDTYAGHFRRYTRSSLATHAKKAGLNVLFTSYFFHYAPPPLFLSRVLPEKLGILKQSSEELRQKEMENLQKAQGNSLILSTLHSMEITLLRNMSIPFGGSVAAVLEVS